jgi:hypothetical protein
MVNFLQTAIMIVLPWLFVAVLAPNEPAKVAPEPIETSATFDERWLPLAANDDESDEDEIGRCRYEQQLREGLERKAKALRAD